MATFVAPSTVPSVSLDTPAGTVGVGVTLETIGLRYEVGVGVDAVDIVGVGVGVNVGDGVAVGVGLGVIVGVAVGGTVGVAVGSSVGVTLGVFVGMGISVVVGVTVAVTVGVGSMVLVGVMLGLTVGVAVGVGVSVGVAVGVGASVDVGVNVGIGISVIVGVGVSSGTRVGDAVGVGMVSAAVNEDGDDNAGTYPSSGPTISHNVVFGLSDTVVVPVAPFLTLNVSVCRHVLPEGSRSFGFTDTLLTRNRPALLSIRLITLSILKFTARHEVSACPAESDIVSVSGISFAGS